MPFMNRTTGFEPTALSIAALVSVDKRRCAAIAFRRAVGYEIVLVMDLFERKQVCRKAWDVSTENVVKQIGIKPYTYWSQSISYNHSYATIIPLSTPYEAAQQS